MVPGSTSRPPLLTKSGKSHRSRAMLQSSWRLYGLPSARCVLVPDRVTACARPKEERATVALVRRGVPNAVMISPFPQGPVSNLPWRLSRSVPTNKVRGRLPLGVPRP